MTVPYNACTGKPPLDDMSWGSAIEHETRRRIHVAVAAYAYEIADAPVMSDRQFDQLAQGVEKHMGTCHPLVDEFFATEFSPMTGMWIHSHPELEKVRTAFERFGTDMRDLYARK